MAPNFKTVPEILAQLRRTHDVIANFIDEVESDDLPRYNNVDQHLEGLKEAVADVEQALVALQEYDVPVVSGVDELAMVINRAISTLQEKKSLEDTGALTEALVAMKNCEAFIQDFMEER